MSHQPTVGIVGVGAMGLGVARALLRAGYTVLARDVRTEAQAEARLGFVGNHTWSHRWLPGLRPKRIDAELERTQKIAAAELARHVFLFRPPYGMRDAVVDRIARRLRLLEVLWSVDSGDASPFASPETSLRTVGRQVRPGSIVLMHDLHPWTASVVRRLLRTLHRRRSVGRLWVAPVG